MAAPMHRPTGFTVIELLVVLASIAVLLAVAGPRYVAHIDRSREVALKENLLRLRDSIDKFQADQGRYPVSLDEMVERGYLRAVPVDPITDKRDWTLVATPAGAGSGMRDIKSSAKGQSRDGTSYETW